MPKMSGGAYIARAFDAYGVSHVFFVPTAISKALYEMERLTGIQRIISHSEKASVYMADGYARATRRPGICMSQNIGNSNLAAGLRDPYLACSPVIALSSGPYDWSRGRHYYQEIEDFPQFKPVTKFSEQVFTVERLPDQLAQAFRSATTGKPGPTHLELAGHAGDTLEYQEFDHDYPTAGPVTVPPHRAEPKEDACREVLRLLRQANRPVIVAGGGVRWSGAAQEVLSLAERLNIPVATSINAKDTIPGNHPLSIGIPGLYARSSANQILLEADLVFYIGSQTGSQVTLTWKVPPVDARVIHLDIDGSELGRNYPDTFPLLGDAKAGCERLLGLLEEMTTPLREEWLRRVNTLRDRWAHHTAPLFQSEQVPIRPERLCAELTSALPSDALLVADTGHAGMWTGGYVDLNSEDQAYIRAAGSLGWGLPAALGAQLGRPARPVVLFTGDGGLWYHVAELETAVRWNIPITVVVNNNRCLSQEVWPYLDAYDGKLHGRHGELWHFTDVDFAALAESIGVRGLTVKKPSELQSALEEGIETAGPVLINVLTDMDVLAPPGNASRAAD